MATSDDPLKVETEEKGIYYLISLSGAFCIRNIVQARAAFEKALEIGHSLIAVDFSGITHLDSTGYGLLTNVYKKLQKNNGKLGIIKPSPYAAEIMEVAKMTNFISIFNSLEDFEKEYC
jgi:anti-anti-sigma factor